MAMLSTAKLRSPNPPRSTAPPPAASTTNDGDLPLDLLYEILLRLPFKPICRFRAVCRSWRSVLCHPEFIAAACHPGPLLAIGVRSSSNEVHVLDMVSGNAVKDVNIIAADNALSSSCHAVSDERVLCVIDKYGRLWLVDLASGASSLLPDTAPPPVCHCRLGIVGRAACTGEQKVLTISITINQHDDSEVFKIFTVGKGGGWRDTPSPPLKVMWYTKYFAVVNGVVYFLSVMSDYSEYKELQAHKIMVFDLHSEAWRPVATTLLGPRKCIWHTLAELDGHLVAGHTDRITRQIELWFLVDLDRSDWSKRYVIAMPCHQQPPMCFEYFIKPLALLDDGRIVLWMRVDGPGIGPEIEVLRIYDPNTQTFMDGTRVPRCNNVSVFNWNLLHSGPTSGAVDMAAKRLLTARNPT